MVDFKSAWPLTLRQIQTSTLTKTPCGRYIFAWFRWKGASMKKWTHNTTGRDYHELGTGPFSSEKVRVNDYDFVVGVDHAVEGFKVFAQMNFDPAPHCGATFYYGQIQSGDPVEFGTDLRVYRSDHDGKVWFRPVPEFETRFTCIADLGQ
jgi:hypothetical protein